MKLILIKNKINQILNYFGYEIKKCQVKNVNKYKWLQAYNINTIFDIGANVGRWSMEMYPYFKNAIFYAFEPLSDCYQKLEKIKQYIPNLKTFNFAFSDISGESIIFRSSQASSSSLLEMGDLHKLAFPRTSQITKEKIQTKTLDEIVDKLKIIDNVLLKIDVQGFEKNVLLGGKEFVKKVKVILIETSFYSLYKEQPLFEDIYSLLLDLGFKYKGDLESIINPIDGSILQANAIFINQH